MKTIGIIAEYNPFHRGHEAQLRLLRERFGPDCAIVVALGGCFTQRGEAALFTKTPPRKCEELRTLSPQENAQLDAQDVSEFIP